MNSQELNTRGWDIWYAGRWVARNRNTGQRITAGTHLTLLHLVNYEEEVG